jgi:DNA repair exonuclease SbcCD ATPase subunit
MAVDSTGAVRGYQKEVSRGGITMIKKPVLLDINDYEPLKKARTALDQAKAKVADLEAKLQEAKAEAQVLEEEAVKLSALAEIEEVDGREVKQLEKKAANAKQIVQELEDALRRAKMEAQVKADLVRQKEAEARHLVADALRDMHKRAVKRLAELLSQAVEVNCQVKEIQEQWMRLNLNGGKFDGLPGILPSMCWEELTPEQHLNGAIVDSKYSLWLKELRRYGYAE